MSGVNTTGYEICSFIIYIYLCVCVCVCVCVHMHVVDESVGLVEREKYTKVGKQYGALSYQTKKCKHAYS